MSHANGPTDKGRSLHDRIASHLAEYDVAGSAGSPAPRDRGNTRPFVPVEDVKEIAARASEIADAAVAFAATALDEAAELARDAQALVGDPPAKSPAARDT